MTSNHFRLFTLFLLIILPFTSFGLERTDSTTPNEIWSRADSPVYITGTLTIPPNNKLTIQPGVEVRFQSNSELIVLGDLVAIGTPEDSIRFTSATHQIPGSWIGITFSGLDNTPSYNDECDYLGNGSVLNYCVLEYAGQKTSETSAALYINTVSPLVKHTAIRLSQGITGTIRCTQNSKPLFYGCRIEGNKAVRGGAFSASIGAQPTVIRSYIGYNTADDNGGAFYLTLGDLILKESFIYCNSAKSAGGAIYAARSNISIENNLFRENRATQKAPNILLTEKVTAKIYKNAFEESLNYIYLENAIEPVEARNNWWGAPPSKLKFTDLIRDRNVDSKEPLVIFEPPLWAPPEKLLTSPSKVKQIILCRDDNYESEIPTGVSEGAPLRIRIDALDTNPLFKDIISVRLTSKLDPVGITIPLYETAPNSGIFTFKTYLDLKTNQEKYYIGDREGGYIIIQSGFEPETQKSYATLPAIPMASDFTIAAVDLNHLTDHKPIFRWSYFEIVERPQKLIRIIITPKGTNIPVWNTGEIKHTNTQIRYDGDPLQDGMTYQAELAVSNGKLWSESVYLTFRMNSLPSKPEPIYPEQNSIVNTLTPTLKASIASDPEGDELLYDFEISKLTDGQIVQSTSKIPSDISEVKWTPDLLEENGAYRFRCRAQDPFESGPWSEWCTFYINTIEELPSTFDLVSPINGITIYDLSPELVWQPAIDPDPLSKLTYEVTVGTNSGLSKSIYNYKDLTETRFKLPDVLDNLSEYYWRVKVTDNTGNSAHSSSEGHFKINTTPSVPSLASPTNGEERKPEAVLAWNASTDPDPRDKIVYDIQVYEDSNLNNIVAYINNWEATSVAINNLNGWEMMVDNNIYYWRARARDNHNCESDFSPSGSFFFNKFNDNPSVPVVIAPGDTVTKTNEIRFAWQPSTDPDLSDPPSTLTYEIQVTTKTFDDAAKSHISKTGADNIQIKLDDNTLWHYRMRARDDEGAVSDWTNPRSVLVNIAEEPPLPFNLNNPPRGSTIATLDSIEFTWEKAQDIDYGSSVSYRLEIIAPNNKTYTFETTNTHWLMREALDNETQYRWRVFAIDNTKLSTICRTEFNFNTNTTPTVPKTLTTSNNILGPNSSLNWSASSDPDPRDKITYQAQISADSKFTEILAYADNITQIQIKLDELTNFDRLKDNLKHYWRVRACDQRGFYSKWSSVAEIIINLRNDNPNNFNLINPANHDTLESLTPTLKWQATSDPDPNAKVSYTISLAKDASFNQLVFNSPNLNTTSYKIPDGILERGTIYYWRVKADDGEGGVNYGSNSNIEPWNFYIKTLPSK